jgi:hypothetical protein
MLAFLHLALPALPPVWGSTLIVLFVAGALGLGDIAPAIALVWWSALMMYIGRSMMDYEMQIRRSR